jgi:hypothetical protein
MSRLPSRLIRLSATAALAAGLLAACTGKVVTEGQIGAPDGGNADTGTGTQCVNVDLTTYDQSCNEASDCVGITAGQVCPGSCGCGGAVINVDGQARYDAATAGLFTGDCPCPADGTPSCVDHVCTLCEPGPGGTCGVTTADAGPPPPDASGDGNVCVDVDPATYDTSCQQSSDCIDITAGTLCSDGCLCGGTAINIDGQARYEQTISSLPQGEECGCPFFGSPTCVSGQCVICFGPGQGAAGCPDGG